MKDNYQQPSTNINNAVLDMKKWRAIIADWEASNESQKKYCDRLGIKLNSFVYARQKIKGNKESLPTFIPVTISPENDKVKPQNDVIVIENSFGYKLSISAYLPEEHTTKILKLCGWLNA